MISLAAYYDALAAHDWDYDSTDDPGVWHRSFAEHNRLMNLADESPDHSRLWWAFRDHHVARIRRLYDRSISVPPLPERPVERAAA